MIVSAFRKGLFSALCLSGCLWLGNFARAADSLLQPDKAQPASAPSLTTLGHAKVEISRRRILVSTGKMERVWHWTSTGLATLSLRDQVTGKEWAAQPSHRCDWDLPGAPTNGVRGELVGSAVHVSDDDGFVEKHLELVSTIRYEQAGLEVEHVVWAFPDAPGLRTQLRVRALPGYHPEGKPAGDSTYRESGATFLKPGARTEYLPLDFSVPNVRLYWGYYNNPGNRRDQSQDMLKEQIVKGWPIFLREDIDWASGVAVKYGDSGVILVKESPKTVNQPCYYTGAFFATLQGLVSTGWGLAPAEVVPDRFRECWANWTILYQGGDDGLQRALKQFEAARYPVFLQRDMFILANTWGPGDPAGWRFAAEPFVLKEIPALAALGIEVLQIDAGWQGPRGGPQARGFRPRYEQGWTNIRKACERAGMRLGLWVAIRNATLDELTQNLDELGFITWKADFDRLTSRTDYETRFGLYRAVMKHAWMKTQFTLCPEYDDPRYGWFFAQEYGSIYFQNVKEAKPDHLTMVPFQVLRQHWLMAKYFPSNKLQVMLQNPQRVGPFSDGRAHSHGYCFAMGLPFVPCFFQSAQYLDEDGQKELRELIALYKARREDIFTSITYPIGELPDNESWSGFQMASTQRPDSGHLLLFRELHNLQPKHAVRLKFLAGKTIVLENVRTGARRTAAVAADGAVEFDMARPADYAFFHYSVAQLAPAGTQAN